MQRKSPKLINEVFWENNAKRILTPKPKKLPRTNNLWTFKNCLADARQYVSKKEWRKNSLKAYEAARFRGWLEACCDRMKQYHRWSLEACQARARKYTTRIEWIKKDVQAYSAARRNKWLDLCCAHMTPLKKPRGYWTLEMCQKDALQYPFRFEWRKKSKGAYEAAQKNKWLNICCAHMMPKPRACKESIL